MRTSAAILFISFFVAACGRTGGDVGSAKVPARERAAAAPATVAKPAPISQMPAPGALTDSAITGRIQSALVGDPSMTGADVSVNTDKGVVVLSGTVQTHEQGGIASAHAQRQDGVMRVDNHLVPPVS